MNLEESTTVPSDAAAADSNPLPAPAPRSRGRLLVVLFLVFLCGGGVGVGATVLAVQNHWVHLFKRPPQPGDIVDRFQAMLSLDAQQVKEVERIVRLRHETMEIAQRQMGEQMDRFDAEIDAVLRPEQQVRWREWLDEMKSKWGPPPGMHHGGPRFHDGPPPDCPPPHDGPPREPPS
jgi:hypothetical protein